MFAVYSKSVGMNRGRGKQHCICASEADANEVQMFLNGQDTSAIYYVEEFINPPVITVNDFKKKYSQDKSKADRVNSWKSQLAALAKARLESGDMTQEEYDAIVGKPVATTNTATTAVLAESTAVA